VYFANLFSVKFPWYFAAMERYELSEPTFSPLTSEERAEDVDSVEENGADQVHNPLKGGSSSPRFGSDDAFKYRTNSQDNAPVNVSEWAATRERAGSHVSKTTTAASAVISAITSAVPESYVVAVMVRISNGLCH
jgi:hypothetical protein